MRPPEHKEHTDNEGPMRTHTVDAVCLVKDAS
jgi:hypothetical protein